jgi:hypothetical protein
LVKRRIDVGARDVKRQKRSGLNSFTTGLSLPVDDTPLT